MTQLLISVRTIQETQYIPLDNVGIIDVKEPRKGALGAASNTVIRGVLNAVEGACPVSAALGELADLPESEVNHGIQLPDVDYAKIGMSRLNGQPGWDRLWSDFLHQLPQKTQPVAVVYADWESSGSPPPGEIIHAAANNRCAAILLDTFDKSQGSVFERMPLDQILECQKVAHRLSMKFVLAGSIQNERQLEMAFGLSPDYIGVRGAVCSQSRESRLCPEKTRTFVSRFKKLALSHTQHPAAK